MGKRIGHAFSTEVQQFWIRSKLCRDRFFFYFKKTVHLLLPTDVSATVTTYSQLYGWCHPKKPLYSFPFVASLTLVHCFPTTFHLRIRPCRIWRKLTLFLFVSQTAVSSPASVSKTSSVWLMDNCLLLVNYWLS